MHLRSAGAIDLSMVEGRRVVRFSDSVIFDYAGYHMTAGRLTLDEAVGKAWAEGGVSLYGPAGYSHASRVWFELATERIILEDLQARMGTWSADAERAELIGQRADLYHVVMTPCPSAHPLYSLHARRLSKESPARYVARGVTPYFYMMPFFYLPRYTYELEPEEEGGALVPSRQGFEFNPGRGNFSGVFVKSTWRKKFFSRRLLSTMHLDYYSKPGPAIGEELQYKSPAAEHYTFAYFTHQRLINQDGYSRAAGYENRWRLWQIWNKNFPGGHFKSFVNEVSDSRVEDDYRFRFDERRLPEREINTELVFDRPNARFKILGERLKTLDVTGPKEYRLERRRTPAVQFLTFPVLIARRRNDAGGQGWRFYGSAAGTVARGRDRYDRQDGALGSGKLSASLNLPLTSRLSATTELDVRSDYHAEKIAGESSAGTQIGGARLTFHRPWLDEWLQSDAGYSYQRAMTNKLLYSADGEVENLLFLSLRRFGRIWKTSLDMGYDFRPGMQNLSPIDFQSRVGGARSNFTSIVRYNPEKHRTQSVYGNGWYRFGSLWYTGLGLQTVHTDTEIQVQLTPAIRFESKDKQYRVGLSGFYDAKAHGWRTRDLNLTRAFRCVETTLGVSKRDRDIQFNFSFRLTGFKKPDELFRPYD